MTVQRSGVGWRFWLWWVLASAVGWFLGFIVGFIGGYVVQEILPNYGNAALGAVLGAGVGVMQWLFLRRRVSGAGWWALANIVGVGVAAVVGTALALARGCSITPLSFGVIVGWIAVAAVGGAMAGIMQWLVLRRQVSRAGWWMLASAVGWAVSVALIVAPESVTLLGVPEVVGGTFGLVSMVGGGVGLGAIAGLALVWLLRQPAKET